MLFIEPGAEVDQLAPFAAEGEEGKVRGAPVFEALCASRALDGLLSCQDDDSVDFAEELFDSFLSPPDLSFGDELSFSAFAFSLYSDER